jgi:carbon storage regulator CsrA
MLVLSRRLDETLIIGDDIKIKVLGIVHFPINETVLN